MHPAYIHNRVFRVEIAAGKFERLEDAHDLLHAGQQLEVVILQRPVVAHHADDGALGTLGEMRLVAERLDLADDIAEISGACAALHDDDHGMIPPEIGT